MKKVLVGLAAIVLSVAGLGCSREPSQAEIKKAEEQMKQESEQISKDLPAKID
jgi:hypothetical protein